MLIPLSAIHTGNARPGKFLAAGGTSSDSPSAPHNPHIHLFEADGAPHLFVVNGSRLYGISREDFEEIRSVVDAKAEETLAAMLTAMELDAPLYIEQDAPTSFPVRALSLSVAQKCNLACTYCYAQEGSFGGPERNMPMETALQAVDLLVSQAAPGETVNLAFLGGEPLVNRQVIRAATERTALLAQEKGIRPTFSITTNGTLLTPEDGDFFERYGFAVTISLDGMREDHDRLRPFKGGKGSYDRILYRASPLLAMQQNMQVSARVTVTPHNLHLREGMEEMFALGFHSVGFSPMLRSPTGLQEMASEDLAVMLEQMIACGEEFERQTVAGRRYPFLNVATALRELHRGTHRPYPCGAGGGYFGVSAEGDLYACHRFVEDADGAMGSLAEGVSPARQRDWLTSRHVDRQEPCRSCWARYLCGGGCHHEVIQRGRPACDYIRGWLHYCLQAYARLLESRPDYFQPGLPTK